MRNAKAIGRLGLLAVGLGIGAVVAATAGTAAADPVWPLDPNVAAASVDGVTGTLGTAAADPAALPDPDIQVSIFGLDLFPTAGNTATASSDLGDLAIAIGNGSVAQATGGILDTAFADGTSSAAAAASGNLDTATALGAGSDAFADDGSLDSATALGAGDHASALDGSLNSATAVGNSIAVAGFGSGDVASIINTGSALDSAQAGGVAEFGGSNDTAFVLGTGSTADAGADFSAAGNFDLGAVFGDMLNSTGATGGNFLVDILPSL
jgi:hypothetical protein